MDEKPDWLPGFSVLIYCNRMCKLPFQSQMWRSNEKGQKVFTAHIWQEYLDTVEQIRKTEAGEEYYSKRKETIERVFADAKEKHGMRYTHHRGLAAVTRWVKLKYAAMNLKKLAVWCWERSVFGDILDVFCLRGARIRALAL